MTGKLYSPKDLADRWQITVETLSNWRVKGSGPSYMKLGQGKQSKVMYREEDVVAWETQNMKRTSGENAPIYKS